MSPSLLFLLFAATAAPAETPKVEEKAAEENGEIPTPLDPDFMKGHMKRIKLRTHILMHLQALSEREAKRMLTPRSTTNPEPRDVEPKDVEPKDVEPKDVEPKDVEPKDVEPKDVEPKDVEPKEDEDARRWPEEKRRHIADIYYNHQKYKEARPLYAWVADNDRSEAQRAWGRFRLGQCHLELDQNDQAEEAFRKVKSDYPTSPWAKWVKHYIDRIEEEKSRDSLKKEIEDDAGKEGEASGASEAAAATTP